MERWIPSIEQKEKYENEGYFIERHVISPDLAAELRGVIRNVIMSPEPGTKADIDPMDPMEDSPQGRIARYRKLANFCVQSPLIWHNVHGGEKLLNIARYFLGDDIIVKFNSCFLNQHAPAVQHPGIKITVFGGMVKLNPSTSGCRLNPQQERTVVCNSYLAAIKLK